MTQVGQMMLARVKGLHFVHGGFDYLSIATVTKISEAGDATEISTADGAIKVSKIFKLYPLPQGVTEEMARRAMPEGSETFAVAGRALQQMVA